MTPTSTLNQDHPTYDVAVVGGGPAGAAAAIFTARYGLESVVFDRGKAALPRCAYLENYPGFPGGIEIGVFRDLLHAHLEQAGATLYEDRVDHVKPLAPLAGATSEAARDGDPSPAVSSEGEDAVLTGGPLFALETEAGKEIRTTAVVAAAWYDGSYLRPLASEAPGTPFVTEVHHGEELDRFDPEYADEDGRTPVAGLYVAGPAGARSAQAIVAAGNGAHVARAFIEDRRRERGLAGDIAPHFDWLRSESEFTGEWADRGRWRAFFDTEMAEVDLSKDRLAALREEYVEAAFATRCDAETAEQRAQRGLERLVETVGPDRILDACSDEAIRERAHTLSGEATGEEAETDGG